MEASSAVLQQDDVVRWTCAKRSRQVHSASRSRPHKLAQIRGDRLCVESRIDRKAEQFLVCEPARPDQPLNKTYESLYQTVNVTSAGQQVNGWLLSTGSPCEKLRRSESSQIRFVAFVLSQEGSAIMAANFEPVFKPMQTVGHVPLMLAPFAFSADTISAKANAALSKPHSVYHPRLEELETERRAQVQ